MAAQLRFNSQAKPVRIRIKSGGEEHSTLGSLCKSFCVIDILDLLAGERLEKWLQRQLNNIENDKIKDVRDLNNIEEHIKSFKNTYKDALSDEERWKQQYTQEDVHIRLMRCFFEMDDAIQTFDQAIKWFQKHDFDRNATLVLNEDMFASHVDLAIYGYEHRDHLAIPLTKTWTEILSHHNTHPKAVWLLSKEQEANGNQIHAIPNVRKAIALGSTEAKDFMSKTLTEEAIQIAKSEQFAGGENDTEIIEASILYKDVPQLYKNIPISEDSLRLDFGFAKWIIRYNRQLCDLNHLNTESLMTIMESYGSEALMWLGDELKKTTDYDSIIKYYKKADELGDNRAKEIVSQYKKEVSGEAIPDELIISFLKDPKTLPSLDKHIKSTKLRTAYKLLFKVVSNLLTQYSHSSDTISNFSKHIQGNFPKWVSVEIDFINAIGDWFYSPYMGLNAFENLAAKSYRPAIEVLATIKKRNNHLDHKMPQDHNPYYFNEWGYAVQTYRGGYRGGSQIKVFKYTNPWEHTIYDVLIYFMYHFKEYRKNQYQDV